MSRRQRGVALMTVLLLVAVMTVLLVAVLDDIRFGQRRAGNAHAQAQAQWYALGAESLAQAQLHGLWQRTGMRTTPAGDWNGRPLVFPVDQGLIEARLTDRSACFNLNSVVEGAGEQLQASEIGLRQFRALLEVLGSPAQQAQALAAALADWIDADQVALPGGAEDAAYLDGPNPYRTAGTLLAEVSELRAVRGFDAGVYARLRPHVCALPVAALSPVNLNMLGPDDAVVLVALLEGQVSLERARRLIATRPEAGWPDVTSFWIHPELSEILPDNATLGQVVLRSRYFALEASVRYLDAEVLLTALIEMEPGGRTRTLARRWTPDE